MKYELNAYSIYELGQRANQEDSIYPAHEQITASDRVFIVCDGMGGHESGEVASRIVCDTMSRHLLPIVKAGEVLTDEQLRAAVNAALDALDAADDEHPSGPKKMGTTMTCVVLHEGGCTIAHIGDSRVYHIRPTAEGDDFFRYVTNDHSLVNELVRVGELTPEEARHSRQKNVITRVMMPHLEQRPKPDIYHSADIKPGDYFYLCSDGMLEQEEYDNRYTRNNFASLSDDPKQLVQRLREVRSENRDNHSAILVRILAVEGEAKVPKIVIPDVVPEPPVRKKPLPPIKSVANNNRQLRMIIAVLSIVVVLLLAYILFLRPKTAPEKPSKDNGKHKTEQIDKKSKTPAKEQKKPGQEKSENAPEKSEDAPEEPEDAKESTKAASFMGAISSKKKGEHSELDEVKKVIKDNKTENNRAKSN